MKSNWNAENDKDYRKSEKIKW